MYEDTDSGKEDHCHCACEYLRQTVGLDISAEQRGGPAYSETVQHDVTREIKEGESQLRKNEVYGMTVEVVWVLSSAAHLEMSTYKE